MNGLSWILYLADVVGNVGITTVLISVASGVLSLALTTLFIVAKADDDTPDEIKSGAPRWLGRALFAFLAAVSIAVIMPSRNTVMLIAASEIGETVLASDAVQKVGGEAGELASDSLRLLHKYVQDQLGEAPVVTAEGTVDK